MVEVLKDLPRHRLDAGADEGKTSASSRSNQQRQVKVVSTSYIELGMVAMYLTSKIWPMIVEDANPST